LENFITEAFAWLLQNHVGFGEFFLQRIARRLGMESFSSKTNRAWITQANFDGIFPDLVCEADGRAFVFEHKAWSHLHINQLPSYRERAAAKYGNENYRLILITAASHLIDQNPDLGLCWYDVHAWIKDWQNHSAYESDFLFDDFCRLLESEGMGPPAEISHAAILSFLPAKRFEAKVSDLIYRASKYAWSALIPPGECNLHLPGHHGRLWGDDKCGFTGFFLLGVGALWSPGISVGFLVDPSDRRFEWLNPTNPDFTVSIDFNTNLYPRYSDHPLYRAAMDQLARAVNISLPDFQFFDHLSASADPNRWHPIHIRMPMLELLRGTCTAEDQRVRLIDRTSSVLRLILDCEPFWALRAALRQETPAPPQQPEPVC